MAAQVKTSRTPLIASEATPLSSRPVKRRIAASSLPTKRQVAQTAIAHGETIAAGKFKATCLQLLDRSAAGEVITITKRGKVVARLVPPEPDAPQPFVSVFGRMKGKIKIMGDIVSPDFDAWKRT